MELFDPPLSQKAMKGSEIQPKSSQNIARVSCSVKSYLKIPGQLWCQQNTSKINDLVPKDK